MKSECKKCLVSSKKINNINKENKMKNKKQEFKVGNRIIVKHQSTLLNNKKGTLRYIPNEEDIFYKYFGIEFDEYNRCFHDGIHKFRCKNGHGYFVHVNNLELFEEGKEINVHKKYEVIESFLILEVLVYDSPEEIQDALIEDASEIFTLKEYFNDEDLITNDNFMKFKSITDNIYWFIENDFIKEKYKDPVLIPGMKLSNCNFYEFTILDGQDEHLYLSAKDYLFYHHGEILRIPENSKLSDLIKITGVDFRIVNEE
jgi:hypothetical protein